MHKGKIWICICLCLFLVILGAGVMGILVPFLQAESVMPEDGVLTMHQQEDGGWLLSWPKTKEADHYLVEVLKAPRSEEEEPRLQYSAETERADGFLLPELEGNLILRVNSAVKYQIFGKTLTRYGEAPLEVELRPDMPTVTELEWTADPELGQVYVTFALKNADSCRAYRIEESGQYAFLETLNDAFWTLSFGEEGALPLPEWEESYGFALAASRKEPGLEIHGMVSEEFRVERQDLLGTNLDVKLVPEEDYGFILTWNETKGAYYEVQELNQDSQWVTRSRVDQGEARRYVSGPLAKFTDFYYRVVAVDGYGISEDGYVAKTDTIYFATMASPMYATVWPVKNLEAYYDANQTEAFATAKTGKAYCVVDEENGMFGVRMGDQIGYIDSNYCMINLPDYMGDLCSYRITNSTSSIYMIHDLEIPDVTGVVTKGYEKIRQSDGSYLVPLLYPTAKKLTEAALSAVNQGYRIRIYDSFRPQAATLEIYDLTEKILDQPISSQEDAQTYRQVMLNDRYSLNSFLAKGASRHNLGVALDLTLENLTSGNAVKMQSAMHDLSWYSVSGRNNASAKTLASIMKDAGFAGLSTEWWHFQDDEATSQLNLPAVYNGVSAEGWTCDTEGWRYRDAKGRFAKDKTITLDGAQYTFDGNGYLTDGQPAFG